MSKKSMHEEDREVILMVRGGLADRRRWEEEAAAELIEDERWSILAVWKNNVLLILAALARAFWGVVFVGGAIEGLMDSAFAAIMAAFCLLWALGYYMKGRSHG